MRIGVGVIPQLFKQPFLPSGIHPEIPLVAFAFQLPMVFPWYMTMRNQLLDEMGSGVFQLAIDVSCRHRQGCIRELPPDKQTRPAQIERPSVMCTLIGRLSLLSGFLLEAVVILVVGEKSGEIENGFALREPLVQKEAVIADADQRKNGFIPAVLSSRGMRVAARAAAFGERISHPHSSRNSA